MSLRPQPSTPVPDDTTGWRVLPFRKATPI